MALGMSGLIGVILRVIGVPDWRLAFAVPAIFTVVMWVGFELFGPFLFFHPDERLTPGAMAIQGELKSVGLYTALLTTAVVLCVLTTGVNPVANVPIAIITYLVGFCITSIIGSFHTTASLARAAQDRAQAEIARFTLEAENARKTQELEEARALQLSMLPSAHPDTPGFDVAHGMRTATEVGGDYYDWRVDPDGALKLAVGDATGHGVRAGLLVVSAKTLFQTGAPNAALDAEMRRVSDGVRSLHLPRMNMALTLATLSPGRARICAGGMPPVLHYRAVSRDVAEVLLEAPPAGQLARARYTEKEIELTSGDRLLFFTDGLPELRDEKDDLFGYERVRDVFLHAAPGVLQTIVDALFAEADAFRGARPPDDDVTLVAVAVR